MKGRLAQHVSQEGQAKKGLTKVAPEQEVAPKAPTLTQSPHTHTPHPTPHLLLDLYARQVLGMLLC